MTPPLITALVIFNIVGLYCGRMGRREQIVSPLLLSLVCWTWPRYTEVVDSLVQEREGEFSWGCRGMLPQPCSKETHLPKRASWRKIRHTSTISKYSCPCWDNLALKSRRKKKVSKWPGFARWNCGLKTTNVQGSRINSITLGLSYGCSLESFLILSALLVSELGYQLAHLQYSLLFQSSKQFLIMN